ncbi:hypothetical protein EC988_002686 [Linderina pennispora]|nr:hypothetical protein EC988_002686 [Linderina pennispora]
MIPDEKKPVPWGLPPLRSEVLARQSAEAAPASSQPLGGTSHTTSTHSEHASIDMGEKRSSIDMNEKRPFIDTPPYEDIGEPTLAVSSNGYTPLAPRPLDGSVPGSSKRLMVLAGGLLMIGGLIAFIKCGMYDPTKINPATFTPTTIGTGTETLLTVENLLETGFDENNTVAWDRLAEMTDLYGHRMTGSDGYDRSAEWVLKTIKQEDTNLTAWAEPVWVNQWVRGSESLRLFAPTRPSGFIDIPVLGLGNSVSTPPQGIEAKIIPVHSFEELAALGSDVISGNIVLFNMHFSGYDSVVKFRGRGAQQAAKLGALAVLVRSATPDSSVDSVHTGNSIRASIPAASVSPADAGLIERMYRRALAGKSADHVFPRAKLVMNNKFTESSKQSSNIIVDFKGAEYPDEIVLLSGHFDSWDVGVGAMDDGAGAFLAWEAARLIAKEGRAARRTIRVVMWNNEETLQRGANAYLEAHKDEIHKHRFAFESDIGVFEPWGLAVQADKKLANNLVNYGQDLIKVLGAGNITVVEDAPGEDIMGLCNAGVPCAGVLSLSPEGSLTPLEPHWEDHYFRHHHANSDRMEVIDAGQLRRSAAALAAWAYLVADMF